MCANCKNRLTTLYSLKKWNIEVQIKWRLESIWLMYCHIFTYVLVKQIQGHIEG